ncbi:MAG: hypothetical protein A2Y81_12770 [Nitrospirae bacterium RBG_13_43_8]|nr:MAG: hypothetical protein A2Y81_12770 [Nitrospirae bacterium RBG_13_43_8]
MKSPMSLQFEKISIIIILITSQTIALHRIAFLDGNDLAVGILFIGFFMKIILRKEKYHFTLLDLLNLGFIGFVILSSINGGLGSLIKSLIAFKVAMLSFLFGNFICKKNVANHFIKWLTITVSISSVIAIIQEIIYIKTGYVLAGSLKEYEYSYLLEVKTFGRTVLRAPGFMVSFKVFSFLLITNMLIIFNRYLYSQFKDSKTKIYFFLGFCLMLIALILTFSKDSMIALFGGIVFSFIVKRPNRIIHILIGLLILGLGIYSVGLYKDIFNLISEEIRWGDVMMRIQVDKDGIYGFINNHFWIGQGFGKGWRYINNLYAWAAHNNIILAADEIGILGLCSYLLLIGYTVFSIFTLNLTVKNMEDKALVRGLFFSIIFLFFLFQTHSGYIDNVLWMYMGIIQGVVLLLGVRPSVKKEIEGMEGIELGNP